MSNSSFSLSILLISGVVRELIRRLEAWILFEKACKFSLPLHIPTYIAKSSVNCKPNSKVSNRDSSLSSVVVAIYLTSVHLPSSLHLPLPPHPSLSLPNLVLMLFAASHSPVAFATPQRGCGSENDAVPEHNLEELPSDLIGLIGLSRTFFDHLEARYKEELNKNYDIVVEGLQFLPYKYTRNSIQEDTIGCLLNSKDEKGQVLSDERMADNIIGVLLLPRHYDRVMTGLSS
ncbi:hypothetical protein FNV43_RR15065 [Rhamnella rubrinervis]|uniref:Uncharacterized protein n=1 Tax=Rhamnella rubrinervis TaxID=2594499 RepID=A0A8K0E862_9ROSA|nr:hypothetical protein FNV43_RR15065 [Rhamnella rubrinervis]